MARLEVTGTWDGSEGAYLKLHNCRPPPIFILLIILVEIFVFICYAVAVSEDNDPCNDVTAFSGSPNGSSLTYYPEKRHEVWRFVTYIFIHKGYFHLIVNILGQVSLGCLLEAAHKYWRVGIVFLGGAIGCVFAVAVTTPYASLNGSSGGVYALTGAQSAVVLMNWKDLRTQCNWRGIYFRNMGYVWLFILLLSAIGDGILTIYEEFISKNPLNIGFTGHIGGFVIGFLLGVIFLQTGKTERWLKIFTWVCVALLTILVLMSVTFLSICGRSGWCPPIRMD